MLCDVLLISWRAFRQTQAFAELESPTFLCQNRKQSAIADCFLFWRRERDSNSRSVISRTHDFQSCALDQLSHLSVLTYISYHKFADLSSTFFLFFYFFSFLLFSSPFFHFPAPLPAKSDTDPHTTTFSYILLVTFGRTIFVFSLNYFLFLSIQKAFFML